MKNTTLAEINRMIRTHPSNTWATDAGLEPVYTASEESKIMIVGQAPGKRAQQSQTPWNDVSGDTLREWLDISKETFYDTDKIALVPMDFYYPGKARHGDLPPRKDFAKTWHPKLLQLMPKLKLIILAGSYAQKYYLGSKTKQNLTATVAAYYEYLPDYFPIVHPSPLNTRWRRLNPWFESDVVTKARSLVHEILKI